MPKHADITFDDTGFMLMGELDFSNVMSVYEKSLQSFSQCQELRFDFSQVKNSNSAGLALIIEWIKLAKSQKKSLQFRAISHDLMAIARVAGVFDIISMHIN